MFFYFLQRIILSLLMIGVLTLLVFIGIYYIGDPVALLLPQEGKLFSHDKLRELIGIDQPLLVQYGTFLKGLFLEGSLGKSYIYGRSSLELILERFPASFELTSIAIILSLLIGAPLGLHMARFPDSRLTKCIKFYALLGMSFPIYWLALILITFFAAYLHWLPSIGRGETVNLFGLSFSFLTLDGLKHLILPVFVLMLFKVSLFIRVTFHFATEILERPYIHFARARGLKEGRIIYLHAFKHLLLPLSTVFGLEFGSLLISAVITESVFNWPGMGKLLIDSIIQLDRPVVIAFVLFVSIFYILMNLILDAFHRVIDPRLRVVSVR